MENLFNQKWLKVKKDRLSYCNDIAVYQKTNNGMIKYKSEKVSVDLTEKEYIPENLYIRYEDRICAYKSLSDHFKIRTREAIASGDLQEIKDNIIEMSYEIFEEPRYGSAIPAEGLIEEIVKSYFSNELGLDIFQSFAKTDYTTITHSMHIMSLALQYCKYKKMNFEETYRVATSAMLHDIGKAVISNKEILTSSRSDLTEEEFAKIKKHTKYGYDLLKDCGLGKEAVVALNHHERIDGSGYPSGKKDIDELSQIIGIIDVYEAMTSDHRIFKDPKDPYHALKELREDAINGVYNFNIYSDFVRSLSSIT